MPAKPFFDTNILIYAFAAGDPRSERAEALLAHGGVIGVQVLNEFTSVLHRKLNWGWAQIDAALTVVSELVEPVRPLTADIHAHAVKLARSNALSFYDALIVAAAADGGCHLLITEDLQHGLKLGTVTIHNPFLAD
jgi:predicted nucleic acid-binding protein